ncbi:MAG: nuclear transport factor 2 family protein [Sphingobacteriales bacterium]|nr:MAG: nuclear transport factor 2 family protein [Sphingobacteriales bacterium]
MKKLLLLIMIVSSLSSLSNAQTGDSSLLVQLNQQIDNYVVQQKVTELQTLYADDFVFSHGSGKVEGKASWLTSVARSTFLSRQHDSVKVELHPGVGVVKGNMSIQRKDKDKLAVYHLKYIRVYALRNKQWQMISHSTTAERHDN